MADRCEVCRNLQIRRQGYQQAAENGIVLVSAPEVEELSRFHQPDGRIDAARSGSMGQPGDNRKLD